MGSSFNSIISISWNSSIWIYSKNNFEDYLVNTALYLPKNAINMAIIANSAKIINIDFILVYLLCFPALITKIIESKLNNLTKTGTIF